MRSRLGFSNYQSITTNLGILEQINSPPSSLKLMTHQKYRLRYLLVKAFSD